MATDEDEIGHVPLADYKPLPERLREQMEGPFNRDDLEKRLAEEEKVENAYLEDEDVD